MSLILSSHSTLTGMSLESLPRYSASSPPPFYSARVNEGEEVLAATRDYQTPTGSFTARCHCGNVSVTLKEQNEDIKTPVYHQQGLVVGTIAHKSTENLLQVVLKIEGKLKLNVSGQNSTSSTVKVIDESYELWGKTREAPSCPATFDFTCVLPSTFEEGAKKFPLPPSHKISLTGIPGLYSQCSYTLKIVMVTRGPLWNRNKSFSIHFKYLPRSRSSEPLILSEHTSNRGGCALFYETIKTAPEVWFEKKAVLRTRPSFKLDPIEVQFFIPSGQKFGLADEIPFHIQLTGPVSSLQALYSHLRLEHVDNDSDVPSDSPVSFTPPASPTLSMRGPPLDSNNFISLSVTLTRQVCVEIKDQAVWKSTVIGEGRVYPLPPPFESGDSLSSGFMESDKMGFLDGTGDIKCYPDVEIGKFNAGKVKVDDFLVLQIGPDRLSDKLRSPFFPLQIAVPISLVYSWNEEVILLNRLSLDIPS
ncbi:hypothetical protein BT96DRAFT_667104 [Gymnopus androsaceus JB14]|uniref:Arrestin-like N-terminal domain-containing protein n=1 Tax=Gymnopus androsaceus JB14 TaxID=1447944 RepID=A0A6A4IJ64_9AGAR|nr:hypothetical protein BT96DRAFT_667104 [Gymnopus androsaceus JB14]